MAYDLTLTTPTYGTGKYGQSLSGGYGTLSSAVIPANNQFTMEAWVKSTSTALQVAVSTIDNLWIGMEFGKAEARGVGTINAGPNINDGAYHHIALTCGASSSTLWVDGVAVGTGTAASGNNNTLVVRGYAGGAFGWSGDVDEVGITAGVKYTGTFTPSPIGNSDANLLAVYHFEGSGVNSQGASSAATAVSVAAPGLVTSNVGVASGNFTVSANGTITGTVVVTPTDSGGGGTFTPTSVSISAGTPTGTVTYTPGSAGSKSITVTNNGSLTNPAAITYTATSTAATAVTVTAPGSVTGNIGAASGSFTVAANGVISGTVVVTPTDSAGGGTFAPTSVSISSGTPTGTFTYTPGTSGAKSIAVTNNGALTNPGAITYTVVNDAWDVTKLVFSPYNWNIVGNTARTINRGAYFRGIITGTTCTLKLDITGIVNTPQLAYRFNGGAWTNVAANTATVALTVPYTSDRKYLLEVIMATSNQGDSRWTTQTTGAKIIGMVLDAGATLTKPASLPLNALYYGDSITDAEGADNAWQGYARVSADLLGAEIGVVAFGSTGLSVSGAGGVPAVTTTYNQLYSGVSRAFTPTPDFIVVNEGTNDGTSGAQASATTLLNGIIAATPASTKIIVLRPFNGNQATDLQNAIAACTAPSRCTYVDTTGFYLGAPLHPETGACINDIAPKVAAAIRPLIQITRGSRTARTVTLTLSDRAGSPRANLSGLKWAFFDQTTAGAVTVNADSGTAATTNASGVLTLSVLTTLAPGATGWLVLSDSAGNAATASNAFSGPVTVA